MTCINIVTLPNEKTPCHKHERTSPLMYLFSSLSCVQLFATPWTAAHQASLPTTNSWSLLKLMSIKSLMPSNYLILRCLLLLPSIFPSIRDEMVGWHHRLDGHEFGWTLGVGDEQGGLACCGSWGHKESDMTE